jgi:hypothetical protein
MSENVPGRDIPSRTEKARLAHDRRFVGAVLLFVVFLFVLVLFLFVFIRISGRHRVAHDHEGTPVDQPSGKVLGDVWGHVVPPLGEFYPGVHRPAGYVAAQLPNTGWPGARSSGGRGFARPVVPGGVSLLAVLVSTSSVVTNAMSIAIIIARAKSMTVVRWLFRSLLMREPPL